MIVREVRPRTGYEDKVVDVICNKCGKSCMIDGYAYGLAEGSVQGGYESTVLGDMVEYKFSLCEPCVGEMFASFKVPVETEDLIC